MPHKAGWSNVIATRYEVRVPETLLILFVVLLIIGARHVTNPERVLGRGVRDFELLEFGRNKRDGELPGENLDEKLWRVSAD